MAENNDSVIDLTSSFNFTLANHNRLNNIVINLDTDDSFCDEENHQSSSTNRTRTHAMRARQGRKRRHSKTITPDVGVGVDPRVPVHDLCTPDSKSKKNSKDSRKQNKNMVIGEEPEEKKTKVSLGPCPICFDDLGRQTLASTKCGHVFCLVCLKQALRTSPKCPICCTKLNANTGYHNLYL